MRDAIMFNQTDMRDMGTFSAYFKNLSPVVFFQDAVILPCDSTPKLKKQRIAVHVNSINASVDERAVQTFKMVLDHPDHTRKTKTFKKQQIKMGYLQY